MSGYGAAANWAGSIFGILITIPLISAQPGTAGRENTFLLAAMAYGVLVFISIVLMFLTNPQESDVKIDSGVNRRFVEVFRTIGVMLLVYLFLFDVMSTVQRNLPPYLSEVIKMPDNTQSIGFLVILVSATIGGFVSSRYVNKENSALWLKVSSLFLGIAILGILVKSYLSLWGAFAVAGICYGILESAIRLNFMRTFTPDHAGENFGMLTIIERTSGLLGPVVWIVPFLLFQRTEAYLVSFALMSLLTITGFLFMLFNYNRFGSNRK
jgi:MFS-type transporter involved in bile tolerance (Atg22 family)